MKPRDHLRLVTEQPAPTAPQPWERSFPAGTIDGFDWVLDVLADLSAFAAHHGQPEIADDLDQMQARIGARLCDLRRE